MYILLRIKRLLKQHGFDDVHDINYQRSGIRLFSQSRNRHGGQGQHPCVVFSQFRIIQDIIESLFHQQGKLVSNQTMCAISSENRKDERMSLKTYNKHVNVVLRCNMDNNSLAPTSVMLLSLRLFSCFKNR